MADIVVGLQYGDEGKGKVVKHLIENNDYGVCVRFNGGPNAGHTLYYKGQKLVTHLIPSGITRADCMCLIGPGCVVDEDKFGAEIRMLQEAGIPDVRERIKVASTAHLISDLHIEQDKANDRAGSTHCGIRPVYRDKYDRCGVRVSDKFTRICCCEVVDSYHYLSEVTQPILFEGAQGFMLDIDHGNYPFVTSSHCTASCITTTGYNYNLVRKVYGVAKIYRTYLGKMPDFEVENETFLKLAELGDEFGATTGRNRQCSWLNLFELKKAVTVNGVHELIINKCDILQKFGIFMLYDLDGTLAQFDTFELMQKHISDALADQDVNITYYYSKDRI